MFHPGVHHADVASVPQGPVRTAPSPTQRAGPQRSVPTISIGKGGIKQLLITTKQQSRLALGTREQRHVLAAEAERLYQSHRPRTRVERAPHPLLNKLHAAVANGLACAFKRGKSQAARRAPPSQGMRQAAVVPLLPLGAALGSTSRERFLEAAQSEARLSVRSRCLTISGLWCGARPE